MTGADPTGRRPIVVGANPGLVLYDDTEPTAFVSVWHVDWSLRGRGTAMVLWHDGTVRVHGENTAMATWLEREFVRHFPEADGLAWPEPVVSDVPVQVDIDLGSGMRAHAGDVHVELATVLDRRAFTTDAFPLADGVEHSLSLVLAPCADGTLTIGGRPVAGRPRRTGSAERPSSSAYLAVAEVWRR